MKNHVGIQPSVSFCLAKNLFRCIPNMLFYFHYYSFFFVLTLMHFYASFITQLCRLRNLYLSTDRRLPVHWGPGPDPAGRWSWVCVSEARRCPASWVCGTGWTGSPQPAETAWMNRDAQSTILTNMWERVRVSERVSEWVSESHLCRSVLRLCLNCGLMWDSRSVRQWHTGVDWAGRGSNTSRVDLKHKIQLCLKMYLFTFEPAHFEKKFKINLSFCEFNMPQTVCYSTYRVVNVSPNN